MPGGQSSRWSTWRISPLRVWQGYTQGLRGQEGRTGAVQGVMRSTCSAMKGHAGTRRDTPGHAGLSRDMCAYTYGTAQGYRSVRKRSSYVGLHCTHTWESFAGQAAEGRRGRSQAGGRADPRGPRRSRTCPCLTRDGGRRSDQGGSIGSKAIYLSIYLFIFHTSLSL